MNSGNAFENINIQQTNKRKTLKILFIIFAFEMKLMFEEPNLCILIQ